MVDRRWATRQYRGGMGGRRLQGIVDQSRHLAARLILLHGQVTLVIYFHGHPRPRVLDIWTRGRGWEKRGRKRKRYLYLTTTFPAYLIAARGLNKRSNPSVIPAMEGKKERKKRGEEEERCGRTGSQIRRAFVFRSVRVKHGFFFPPLLSPLGDNRMSFDCSLVEPTIQESLRVLAFFNWRLKYRSIDRIFQAFVKREIETWTWFLYIYMLDCWTFVQSISF